MANVATFLWFFIFFFFIIIWRANDIYEDKTYLKFSSYNDGGVNISYASFPFWKSTPAAEFKLDSFYMNCHLKCPTSTHDLP